MKEEIKKAITEYFNTRSGNIFDDKFPNELAEYIVHHLEGNNVIVIYPIERGNTKNEII